MALRECLQIQCFFPFQKPPDRTPHRQLHNGQPFRVWSSKLGVLSTTHQAFDEIPLSDTFAWNTLVQSHLSDGDPERAMLIYHHMLLRGVRPDKHTLPRILTASRLSGSLFYGKQIHGQALKLGFGPDEYVLSALMSMYGHLDSADTAQYLFSQSSRRNKVSWTLLVGLYIKEDKPKSAIDTFLQMVSLGFEVDDVALVTVSGACGRLKSLQEGRKVHEIARRLGLESNVLVSNSLLKMYLDCNSIRDARLVFDRMRSKDAISWTAIVRGYVKNGGFNEGLKLFRSMNFEGIKPDSLTVSSVLPACARISASKHGKEIHAYVIRNNINLNVTVQNAMMDMYAKSGFLEYASEVFARMGEKDAISWTVMILGYSLHGQGELAVELFREVEKHGGIEPDQIMYVALLHACCTARMVEEGRSYFNHITAPKVDHYALMVALLAQAGHFDEARAFIKEYQIERHAEVQRALLNGCRLHRNMNIAKRVIDQLIELEPLNAENYVVLSNFYAASTKMDMLIRLKEVIRDMGLKPRKAYSWIEVQNKFHVFGVGDVSHPRSVRIYEELQGLMKKMEEQEGYVPDADFSLHDVDEERECIPIGHSEMLAISFGLISMQGRATIRVTKNLRVCRNSHNFAKFISKIVGREILLKDPNYFHHFKDGFCSCGDFW
ncbi:pentatricopeptide repeat-containing protein At3g12770-like [Telopea speciosissima]|uniref:pentatricopeptide repeat-containing protein At3g12770-like n=1 Tax=Telopea speciosissima TaxID=54955 RepID=UPI001CC41C3A|nr:pentatricopeptide repeat-containing protein At3g12770-like [Telopea speciosissima]